MPLYLRYLHFVSNIAVNLTATDPSGTWSGAGITDPALGTFDPQLQVQAHGQLLTQYLALVEVRIQRILW